MNHRSERLSPGGSHTLSCHCTRRLVLVTVPSFSAAIAARQEEHLGADVARARSSPLCDQAALLPEIRGLGHREVAHDQPVELRQAALAPGRN